MSSKVHTISDSDDDDHQSPTCSRSSEVKKPLSVWELFGGSEDEEIKKLPPKRKRVPSTDSDRTMDPDEDPVAFFEKSKKRTKKDVSDSDSDITVDYSPPRVLLSDSGSDSILQKLGKTSKPCKNDSSIKPASSSKKFPVRKSLSRDHEISDSDSEIETCAKPDRKTIKNHESNKNSKHSKPSPASASKSSKGNIGKSPRPDKNTASRSLQSSSRKSASYDSAYSAETVELEASDEDDNKNAHISAKSDNKPVCRYGSTCYRKNPSHLKEFRHPHQNSRGDETPSTSYKRKDSSFSKKSPAANNGSPYLSRKHSGGRPESDRHPGSAYEVLKDAGPLGFFLTKVTGIEKTYNNRLAMDIKDILSPSMGNLQKSAQFNYMTDIPWLVSQYPTDFRTKPLMIVHGCQRGEKSALEREASPFSHIRLCQAKLEIVYGTHHTKMMFLVYDNGMRIVIHTSNLIKADWYQKTQGMWISPLFPRLPEGSSTAGESPTYFKRDLLEYVTAYKAKPLDEWALTIRQHDMSSARVFIIGSIPGRHLGQKKIAFGHLRLRKLLEQHGPTPLHVKNWPVIGQFSSIGSLGANKDAWVCKEWLSSLSASKSQGPSLSDNAAKLKLIFPSADNVRLSLEGYPAGASLPYSIHTAKKQPWLHSFFHQWKSRYRGRSVASPHIKTYLRISPDWLNIAWFLVTSANLSKAAWGALEKNGLQLMIRSYELGVLFLPTQFGSASSFRRMKDISENLQQPEAGKQMLFPVPYDLPPTEYTKDDRPWIWDIQYRDKPDTNGNMWCPS